LRGEYEPVDFKRTFEILEDVDEEGITANLQHGVLKVVLPKVEAPKARKIQIKVNE
jgi:HSP20 family molecular chaperone IbpA